MQKFDVLIIGGGMVGLTLALALRQQRQLTVALVDPLLVGQVSDAPDVRVSAINIASQQIFANLNVWSAIECQRVQAYQHMHIWDKNGYGKLDFDHQQVNQSQLGWIVENNVIRQALWQQAQLDDGISFFTDEAIATIGVGDSEVFASFSTAKPIMAKLVVGADGANSWLRTQMNMPIAFRDYDHHAIVATVACAQGHQDTAWQVFLPTGPLAFLPLFAADLCSIVWSTSPAEAVRLSLLSNADFGRELTAASDGKLGQITLQSERCCFPLTMRLAHDFVKNRVVLIGDAAHTIHPLAGQGVNLGLLDAAALAQTLIAQVDQQRDISDQRALNAFARWRRTDAAEMIAAMEAIKQLFTPQQALPKLLRGLGMSVLDNFSPLKNQLINQALGLKSHLPDLAKPFDPCI